MIFALEHSSDHLLLLFVAVHEKLAALLMQPENAQMYSDFSVSLKECELSKIQDIFSN